MRILVVQESDWLSRGPHQQHHLMEKLALRGHEVRVIDYEIAWRAQRKGGLYSRRRVFERVSKIYRGASVTVIRPAIVKLPHIDYLSIMLSHTNEIARQIREFRPDILIGFGILNTHIAMRLAKKSKIPFAYYLIDALHTLIPSESYQLMAKVIERKTLQEADRVIVINEELRNYGINMGANSNSVSVIRAGIDPERFSPQTNGQQVRRLYGIKKREVVLLFMGWLYDFSGLKEVALELVEARAKLPNIKVLVVGEGDLLAELNKIKETHNLEQLILAGRQPYDRIPAFVAASDICLLPAHDNSVMRNIVPIKMYEYLACGKPVICTKLPGIMKEFGVGSGVIYVDRPADVLWKAVEMTDSPGDLDQYASGTRRLVERFSWEKIADEFETLLETMITNQQSFL